MNGGSVFGTEDGVSSGNCELVSFVSSDTKSTDGKKEGRPEYPHPRDSLFCDVDIDNGEKANNEGKEEGNHKTVTFDQKWIKFSIDKLLSVSGVCEVVACHFLPLNGNTW